MLIPSFCVFLCPVKLNQPYESILIINFDRSVPETLARTEHFYFHLTQHIALSMMMIFQNKKYKIHHEKET